MKTTKEMIEVMHAVRKGVGKMKKKLTTIILFLTIVFLLTACVKDTFVVLDKKCVHHTFSSDNYYFIVQSSDGKKGLYSMTEPDYVLYNVGDTIELYR